MCDFTKYLPADINGIIAKKVDLESYPRFMATCKSTRSHISQKQYIENVVKDVEARLNSLIEVVKEYNSAFNDKEMRCRIADTLLQKMYHKLNELSSSSVSRQEMDRHNYHLRSLLYSVLAKVQTTPEEIVKVWKNHSIDSPYDKSLIPVLEELRNSVINDNAYCQDVSYKNGNDTLTFNFSFDFSKDKFTLGFFCSTNEHYLGFKDFRKYIPGATTDHNVMIFLDDTPQNIRGLAELIVYEIGVDIMIHGTDVVSNIKRMHNGYFISAETNQGAFDSAVDPHTYMKRILDILG